LKSGAKPEAMKSFEKNIFKTLKQKTAHITSNNDRIQKVLADLEEEKVNTISL
jgi:hypothetical protein